MRPSIDAHVTAVPMTADRPFHLTLAQPRWSATAVTMEDAGTAGERLVARVRVVLCGVLLFIPLTSYVLVKSRENVIGLSVTFAALAISTILLLIIDRASTHRWLGFATTAAEPDVLVKQLAEDTAIAAADTLLLTVPNQLGVDYNAHVLESVLRYVAPELGWR